MLLEHARVSINCGACLTPLFCVYTFLVAFLWIQQHTRVCYCGPRVPAAASVAACFGCLVSMFELRAGTMSGFLLGKFCPNDGVSCGEADPGPQIAGYRCQGHMMWLIITFLTCLSPFGILIFQVTSSDTG